MTDASQAVELVLKNARIYTVDPARPWAESVAIGGGRIVSVGSFDEIEPLLSPSSVIIDLAGQMVLPGINDAHCHVFEGTRSQLFEIEINPASSFANVVDVVQRAASQGSRAWITGGCWGPALADELASEDARRAIDKVSAGRPVVLRDLSFHSRFANSSALAAAGINDHTPDPENGVIVRDAKTRRPTGLLHESAAFLMDEAAPPWTTAENIEAARKSVQLYNSLGVTGFQLAVASRTTMSVYKSLDLAGELSAWVAMFIAMEAGLAQARDGIGTTVVSQRADFASPHIGVDFAKFFMDGVPSMRTAAFVEPYLTGPAGQSDFHVRSFYSASSLAEHLVPLDRSGLSVKIHAIGDLAVRDVLDAVAIVRERNGGDGPQHQIAHLNFIRGEDIPRLRQLNVLADLCPPLWFPSVPMQTMKRLLGAERVDRSWPIRTIFESGADMVAGTDWPAISPTPSPWPGMASLITRKNPYSISLETHAPDQAIDLATAIELYTSRPSRAMRIGERTGTITPGKSADMIVLDRNLFEVPAEEIAETKVRATLFEGRCVYGALNSR